MTDPADLGLLVATGSQSFTETVSENLRTTGMVRDVTIADSASTAIAQAKDGSVDGVVIDDRLEEPVTTTNRLTAIDSTAVVLLTQGEIDDQGIETVLDEGAIDLFPRTTASPQYELVAERIQSEQENVTAGDSEDSREERDRRQYREIFENVSDGLVIHDPETGEIEPERFRGNCDHRFLDFQRSIVRPHPLGVLERL